MRDGRITSPPKVGRVCLHTHKYWMINDSLTCEEKSKTIINNIYVHLRIGFGHCRRRSSTKKNVRVSDDTILLLPVELLVAEAPNASRK